MRSFAACLFLVASTIGTLAHGAERKNVYLVVPSLTFTGAAGRPAVGGGLSMLYERALADPISVWVGPSYSPPFLSGGAHVVGASVGTRIFFLGTPAPGGIWIGPDFAATFTPATSWSVGAHLGFTFVEDTGFSLLVGLGARYLRPFVAGSVLLGFGYAF